jgi:hypothetical protein
MFMAIKNRFESGLKGFSALACHPADLETGAVLNPSFLIDGQGNRWSTSQFVIPAKAGIQFFIFA